MSTDAAHPRRPAGGGPRPRQPSLSRLWGAAVRRDGHAVGPARGGQPLRELRPRGGGRIGGTEEALHELDRLEHDGGCGSSTGPAPRPRSAAPAGLDFSPAPATCSRSSRCDAWSRAATRSSGDGAGHRPWGWRSLGKRCSTASPSAATLPSAPWMGRSNPGRAPLAAPDRRPDQRRVGDPGTSRGAADRAGRRGDRPRRGDLPVPRADLAESRRGPHGPRAPASRPPGRGRGSRRAPASPARRGCR